MVDSWNLFRGDGGTLMAKSKRAKKFEKVGIEFMNSDIYQTEEATVILRGDEMVLDIQAFDDNITDYLIVGRPVKYYFQGVNSAGQDMAKVLARWVKLGSGYVGRWVEDGQEYLFSFELTE